MVRRSDQDRRSPAGGAPGRGRVSRGTRTDPSATLRPTGVVLFATLDDPTSMPVGGVERPRVLSWSVGTFPWRRPSGRRVHDVLAWLLGR
jgi:hypothetical protein